MYMHNVTFIVRGLIYLSAVSVLPVVFVKYIYRTQSEIFISWVGGQSNVYYMWSTLNMSELQPVNPLPS